MYIAYEVLSNAEKRRIYDQHGEAGLKQQQQGGNAGFHDPFDIFSQYGNLDFAHVLMQPALEVLTFLDNSSKHLMLKRSAVLICMFRFA